MSQAVANLLINAAQYTPPGGHIGLAAHLETDAVTISVKDTGVGFQPTAIPAMFDMFTVVAPAGSRSEGGLSIGLSFVKGLIALHDGTVEAKSAGAGGGAEFVIRLPRAIIVGQEPIRVQSRPWPPRLSRAARFLSSMTIVTPQTRCHSSFSAADSMCRSAIQVSKPMSSTVMVVRMP